MPSIAHVASTTGDTSPTAPPAVRVGGGVTTLIASFFTPATIAGTPSMITVDGYDARPPGTTSPTLSTGVNRSPSVAPPIFTGFESLGLMCFWYLHTLRIDA